MPNEKLLGTGSGQTTLRVAAAVLLVAVALLLVVRLPAEAQANDRDVGGVTLTSPNPGELVIAWDAPGNAPTDYRVTWKKSTARWTSYKRENTVDGGNAFPTGTSHTVTGLEEGTAYQARVRARYHNSGGKVEKSGPWSAVEEIAVAQTPPPGKPTGLITAASHDNVLLFWTDPGDTTITGYQVLRGPDAGDANASYTDSNVAAQTTYVYAVKARNADGLGPQSDTASVTTPAAPTEDDDSDSAQQSGASSQTEPSPGDWPSDTTTPARLRVGSHVDGRISTPLETDWIRVELTAGQGYVFVVNSVRDSDKIQLLDRKFYDALGTEVS